MLVPQLLLFELLPVGAFVDLLKDVLELPIVLLQDGVLGRHVQRVPSLEGELEAAMRELSNAFVGVVHGESDPTFAFEFVHFHLGLLAVSIALESHCEGARLIDLEVSCLVLVSEGVPADDDGLFPPGNESGDVVDEDGLSEHCAVEDVPDGAVGTLPHLLQSELLDPGLVGSDGGALDSDLALFDGLCGIEGDFIISFVPVLHSQVEVVNIDVKEGQNQLFLDAFPNNSGHFVPIQLRHRILDLDLRN